MLGTLTLNNRTYLLINDIVKSFIDDIKYYDNGSINMVCEIPKNSLAKMEITYEENNPIKQDILNGNPRFFDKCIPWNYGAIPQTLENKSYIYKETGLAGDGDPLDIIDIGSKILNIGEIIQVKVLGVLPLIDEGETDWKIIAINKNDKRYSELNKFSDLNENELLKIYDWFINYKLKSKNIKNEIGFNGRIEGKELAYSIIKLCNEHWKENLINQII